MVTVAKFDFPEGAHLARMVLANNDIDSYVYDENIIQLYWLYCYAIGGVRLVVRPEDHELAIKVLRSCINSQTDEAYDTISVPSGHLLVWFISVMIGVPCFFFGRRKYYCDRKTNKILSKKPDKQAEETR